MLHTRLRLGHRALNDYLFKINCKPSPRCSFGFETESVMHYFFTLPLFAASRAIVSSPLSNSNDKKKGDLMLNGSRD